MAYTPDKHHRRSIRLQGYDYSSEGLYFITLVCQNRAELFGEVRSSTVQLNAFGKIALEEWYHTARVRDNLEVHESVVMPNHLHGILEITQKKGENEVGAFRSPSHTIGAIIRGYKVATINKIKELIKESLGGNTESNGELLFAPTVEKILSLDYKIWQRNYYEHIIRNEQSYYRISEYIKNNPAKWEEDKLKIR